MELLVIGLAVGGLLGVKGKDMVKSAAKGYFTMVDRSKQVGKNIREDFRDAVEEARYEYDHPAAHAQAADTLDSQNGHHLEDEPAVSPVAESKGAPAAAHGASTRKAHAAVLVPHHADNSTA